MTSSERPDADALEQAAPVTDSEDRDDDLRSLDDSEVNPADAVEQRRDAGGDDDDEDYPAG